MTGPRGASWEDLSVLLATLQHGSLNRAATSLQVSQSTASRRLARLEERLGGRLFDRTPEGLQPTALAHSLAAHAELIETHMADIDRLVERREAAPSGRIKLALPDGLASAWLIPKLHTFYEAFPDVSVDLVIGHAVVDLVRREADLALRFVRPTASDLVAARVGDIPLAPYVHPSLVGQPAADLRWIVFDDPDSRYIESQWVQQHIQPTKTQRVTLWNALFAAIEHGHGAGIVSPLVAEPAGLVQLPNLPPVPGSPLYLVYHQALRDVPRIAAFRGWFLDIAKSGLSGSLSASSSARTRLP